MDSMLMNEHMFPNVITTIFFLYIFVNTRLNVEYKAVVQIDRCA